MYPKERNSPCMILLTQIDRLSNKNQQKKTQGRENSLKRVVEKERDETVRKEKSIFFKTDERNKREFV